MAATTRIFAYCKGLIAQGNEVSVISIIPRPDKSFASDGVFDGVNFKYINKSIRSEFRIKRYFQFIHSITQLPFYFFKNKFSCIIVSSDALYLLFIINLIKCFLPPKKFLIFDEYPIPIRKYLKKEIPAWKKRAYAFLLRQFNGYISMTKNLLGFYQKLHYKPGIIVSSITDISRFKYHEYNQTPPSNFIITYTGNLELSKDNVDNIILAFSKLKHKNSILNLYGRPSNQDRKKILSLIKETGMTGKVLLSYAQYDEIPNVLCNSHILVSSQPNTIRAAGGFPTKLGEYLMSGRPVLLTKVGEIDKYFTENVHLFFVEPDNSDAYSQKLDEIMDNYKDALIVADKGRNKIINEYSHIKAGEIINNFLNQF
ncbi:MAG: glycosyltransferase [Muribaculum sp.]|nr:glycosyltransferase [Muribaculum sp.]